MVTHVGRTAALAIVGGALAAGAVGCASQKAAAPAPPVRAGATGTIAMPAGARAYDIDPARSTVTVLVYRAGRLARLGHNHAITSGRESGAVWLGNTAADSGFEIHVPVAEFVVDDPQARALAGPDFPGTVPDEARQGTTANMLRAEVLDAADYPEIVVRADRADGDWQHAVVHATVRIRDVGREVDVPVELAVTAAAVTAKGAFQARQTDFGITPFSVGGGALAVADAFDVRFEITAVARP
jgi:polyisoprenoid-binding protein YceI